jgi:NTE family protein
VRFRGRLLTDGGVCNNTPISHAVQLGAERIYVLPTAGPGAQGLPSVPGGAPGAAVNALTQLFCSRLKADLARYATAAEMVVLPAANPRHVALTNFAHAAELIDQARTAARTALAARDAHPELALAS